ncbi:hypothetical protein MAR_021577 [Mya arenaria]|uniref:Uncharacterized protein n=1 Tax=Mya arenaria TaxID=6604 RepID=A0ABY7E8A3_MYAAR|nr:hypothetical protein MAR_021577 [Mya arenaria]
MAADVGAVVVSAVEEVVAIGEAEVAAVVEDADELNQPEADTLCHGVSEFLLKMN